MSEKTNILLTPFQIGRETIKNRMVMGPMAVSQLFDSYGAFNDEGIEFYTERAKGGFGLIYTGCMVSDVTVDAFDPKTINSPLYAPARFINRASRLNERCNAYGAKVIAELTAGGGRNYPMQKAPSAVECYAYPMYKGIELTVDEIHQKRDQMIKAAAVCQKAGFAGVDIHSLHWGYLLDEFVLSITNKREDEYGGCLENRMRLIREMIGGIKQVCGSDYPVTVGLHVKSFIKALNKASLTGEEEAGRTVEEAVEIAKMLESYGVDAILTDVGIYDSFYYACPPSYMPKGHGLPYYEQVKKNVNIPILGRSRMGDPVLAAEAVEKGQIDAVVLSRPSLADAYFPRKVEMGVEEKIRPCIGCNMGCIGPLLQKGTAVSCAVNPRAFNELTTRPKKTVWPRNIAVIGGGAAGMQAALTAAECGHKVELFEKTGVLGGEMNAAGAHSFKVEIHQLRDWYIRELREHEVPVHMNCEISADEVKAKGFDTVILATGASALMPASIEGIDKAVSAVDLLEGKKAAGDTVVVVGGGMVGCETAVDLAKSGKKVTVVEALNDILSAEFVPQQHKLMLKDLFEYHDIAALTGKKLVAVTGEGAVVEDAEGKRETVPADTVVMSIGLRPNKSLAPDYYGKNIAVYQIGSAQTAGNIITAVHEGFEVVYNMD